MRIDTEKSTFEWARFGEVSTEFQITNEFIELLKPFGKKYYFKFSINSGKVFLLQNGSQKIFDSCTVAKKEGKPKENKIVKLNSDFRKNKYIFNCIKDGRHARDRGGYIIDFDFSNNIVEWVESAHDQVKGKTVIDIFEVDGKNPVRGDGGYKYSKNIIYTKSYDNIPRYFNLESGEVFTKYGPFGRDLEKEFLDGRWSRGLKSQNCILSASESKIDELNLPQIALSNEFNKLSPENKINIKKYILEFSDFKDKDNAKFDPLSTRGIKYKRASNETFNFDNLFINYIIQLSSKFERDGLIVKSEESANRFLQFLIQEYTILSSADLTPKDVDNYIDEKSIQNMCINTITYLENALHIFVLQQDSANYYDSDFLINLFRSYGLDVLSLKNYKLNKKFSLNDIKSSDSQKIEYCSKESNLVKDYAGRELIQDNNSIITKYIILETNSLERERLNGTWLIGDSFTNFNGITTGRNGRSLYNGGVAALGRQITEELKQVLAIPFVIFVHETYKSNIPPTCFAEFTGFSKTTEAKSILDGRASGYADGFSLSYWGVPFQFYSPRDQEGMYFIGRGPALNVSKFYSSFDNKFDFEAFKNNYKDLSYTASSVVPLKKGKGVNRDTDDIINSPECTIALRAAREKVSGYLNKQMLRNQR